MPGCTMGLKLGIPALAPKPAPPDLCAASQEMAMNFQDQPET